MGGLSRKRKQPRIVRKVKPKSGKRIHVNRLDPYVRAHWVEGKSLKENFASLGLALQQNPDLKHTEAGRAYRDSFGKKKPRVQKEEDVEWVDLDQLKKMQGGGADGAEGHYAPKQGNEEEDSDEDDDSDMEMDEEEQVRLLKELEDEGRIEVIEEEYSLHSSDADDNASDEETNGKDKKKKNGKASK